MKNPSFDVVCVLGVDCHGVTIEHSLFCREDVDLTPTVHFNGNEIEPHVSGVYSRRRQLNCLSGSHLEAAK